MHQKLTGQLAGKLMREDHAFDIYLDSKYVNYCSDLAGVTNFQRHIC